MSTVSTPAPGPTSVSESGERHIVGVQETVIKWVNGWMSLTLVHSLPASSYPNVLLLALCVGKWSGGHTSTYPVQLVLSPLQSHIKGFTANGWRLPRASDLQGTSLCVHIVSSDIPPRSLHPYFTDETLGHREAEWHAQCHLAAKEETGCNLGCLALERTLTKNSCARASSSCGPHACGSPTEQCP